MEKHQPIAILLCTRNLYVSTAGGWHSGRAPHLFAVDPKLLVKEALAFQELTDHGLTGRKIAIL